MTQTEKFGDEFEALERDIRSAENFEELYVALERAQVIEGSQKTYTFEEIKALIEPIRETIQRSVKSGIDMERTRNIPMIGMITNTHNLRNKVIELLDKEKESFDQG